MVVVSVTLWNVSKGKSWRGTDAAKQRRRARAANIKSERSEDPREKNWKLVYLRSNKLARARQLGFEYPRQTRREVIDQHMTDEHHDESQ